ncbi:MAG: hypothetical protein EA374_05480 [Acholeplasmatales bacterium]|nr:MAG: hypothetical protein EA374_05480 [Acholeplasmatales bacterium]
MGEDKTTENMLAAASPPVKRRRMKMFIGLGLGLWLVLSVGFALFVMFFSVWLLESCVGIT